MAPTTPRALARTLRPTPWDTRLFARTLLLAAGLGALVLAVGAATDEQSALWTDRVVRLGALAPVWAGAAFGLTKGQALRRGEGRALTLLGVGPRRLWAGAWAASSGLGLLFAAALLARVMPLRSLFPALEPSPWRRAGANFEAPGLGLRWAPPDDRFAFFAPLGGSQPGPPRPWLVVALAAFALLVPFWLALPARTLERVAAGFVALALALFVFHLVARGAPGAWLLAAPGLLAADAARLDARARARPFALRRPAPSERAVREPRAWPRAGADDAVIGVYQAHPAKQSTGQRPATPITLCCCPSPRLRACARARPRARCAYGRGGPYALSSRAEPATRDDDERSKLRD